MRYMRSCQSCEKPLPEDARADAIYCDNKRCRSRAYRQRKKASAAALPPVPAEQKAAEHSFVVQCSCGNRMQIQVTQLGPQQGDHNDTEVHVAEDPPSATQDAPAAVASDESLQESESVVASVSVDPPPQPAPAPTFRTYEIFGRQDGRSVPLPIAPTVSVPQGLTILIGDGPIDGFGLAGTPGRWRDFYGDRSPTDFGQDADRAVMYWEQTISGGRGVVFPAAALTRLFGPEWRKTVY